MIELLTNLPDHVVGIAASGEVTADEYESVIIPAIEAKLAAYGRVWVLYQLGPAFTGFTSGALWDDLRLGVAHFRAWEKLAIVTDLDWMGGAIRLFGFALPCPVQIFPNAELAEAVRWIKVD
ncbi:STAS/SEC14 domain-containing protein [Permianibacter sp. IMCC34836]|uniref:STAS/SEC14 domain-containing protein n=1 Tax=Permianibacter fluminis TaxID=2738515 RepID=UPI001552F837|nr:STAS/SEC14 domain-containing protein [Permianibacter fluminis]NQD35899.1 STAS/SEC14 domain-containing protein [Permianibacter fluminis]